MARQFETVAVLTNDAVIFHVSANDKLAWNTARQWATGGIEDRYRPTEDGIRGRGHLIPPTMIKEVVVREHDPERWVKKDTPAAIPA